MSGIPRAGGGRIGGERGGAFLQLLLILAVFGVCIAMYMEGMRLAAAVVGFLFILQVYNHIFAVFRIFLKFILFISTALFLLIVLTVWWDEHYREHRDRFTFAYNDEGERSFRVAAGGDTVNRHIRIWHDYTRNRYEMSFGISDSECRTARRHREIMPLDVIEHGGNYWGTIYAQLAGRDSLSLGSVYAAIDSLQDVFQLDFRTFAEALVSFVQDIPYTLVLSGPCEEGSRFAFIRDAAGELPCLGNEAYGIRSPVEFMHGLEGDCDTRAVLLYTLLRHYGYDAIILISRIYEHAMLAVAGPWPGTYVEHKAKKYYVWETTAAGWTAGNMPPQTAYLGYWEVELENPLP